MAPRLQETGDDAPASAIVAVLLVAVVLRVGAMFVTQSWQLPPEAHHFAFGYEAGQIAASLAEGHGFTWPSDDVFTEGRHAGLPPIYEGPTAWIEPGYPAIIAVAFRIFGTFSPQAALVLELFQTACSVLNCWLLFLLSRRVYDAATGVTAAAFLAVYPASIGFATQKPYATTLVVTSFLFVLILTIDLARAPSIRRAIGTGIVFGAGVLVSPMVATTYPVLWLWACRHMRAARGLAVRTIGVAVLASALPVLPWMVRNYAVFGEVVPIKSNLGNELFQGNNPYADGNVVPQHASVGPALSESERQALRSMSEPQRTRYLARKAIGFITESPARFAKLTFHRIVYYWTDMKRERRDLQTAAALSAYALVACAALAGLLSGALRRAEARLLLLAITIFPLPYYVTVIGNFRYRYPIEPLLICFAAYATCSFARRARDGRSYRNTAAARTA